MPQIPSRLPREYESPSPDHCPWYTGVVNTVLRYSNVLHLHQRVCHKVGQCISILQYCLSGNVPQTFLCHGSSRFELIPQSPAFLPCNPSFLSFNLPVFCLLCRGSCHLQEPEFDSTCCHALLCPLATACSSSSMLVPFSVSHTQGIFCTRSRPPAAYPLFLPNRDLQSDALLHFPKFSDKYFGPLHFLGIFMYLLPLPHLMHRYLLASLLFHKRPPFFRHSSTKQ